MINPKIMSTQTTKVISIIRFIEDFFMDHWERYGDILSAAQKKSIKQPQLLEKLKNYKEKLETFVNNLMKLQNVNGSFELTNEDIDSMAQYGRIIDIIEYKMCMLKLISTSLDHIQSEVITEPESYKRCRDDDRKKGENKILDRESSIFFVASKILDKEQLSLTILFDTSYISNDGFFNEISRAEVLGHLFVRGFKNEFLKCIKIRSSLMDESEVAIQAAMIYLKDGAEGKDPNGLQKAYDLAMNFLKKEDTRLNNMGDAVSALASLSAKNLFLYGFFKERTRKIERGVEERVFECRESSITAGYEFGEDTIEALRVEDIHTKSDLVLQLYGIDALIKAKKFNVHKKYKFSSQFNKDKTGVSIAIKEKDNKSGGIRSLGNFNVPLSRSIDLVFLNAIKVIVNKKAKSITINKTLAETLKGVFDCIKELYPIYKDDPELDDLIKKIDAKVEASKKRPTTQKPDPIKSEVTVVSEKELSVDAKNEEEVAVTNQQAKSSFSSDDEYTFRDILDILRSGGKQLTSLFRTLNLELERVKGSHHMFKTPKGEAVLMSGSKATGTQHAVAKRLFEISNSQKKPRRRGGRRRNKGNAGKL